MEWVILFRQVNRNAFYLQVDSIKKIATFENNKNLFHVNFKILAKSQFIPVCPYWNGFPLNNITEICFCISLSLVQ